MIVMIEQGERKKRERKEERREQIKEKTKRGGGTINNKRNADMTVS